MSTHMLYRPPVRPGGTYGIHRRGTHNIAEAGYSEHMKTGEFSGGKEAKCLNQQL